jgi:hypothetical protein
MLRRVAIAFLLLAGCAFEVSLGPADGVRAFRFEEDVPNPALAKQGEVSVTREVEVIDEERSRRYLASFGPDKIGSIRRVSLEIVDVRIVGADLAMSGPPTLVIFGHSVTGERGATVELEDGQVDWLRGRLLAGEPVGTTLTVYLEAPLDALDARSPSLHIVVEVQPTLVIDVL